MITGLMEEEPFKRLGNDSSDEILGHPFFEGLERELIESRLAEVPQDFPLPQNITPISFNEIDAS